MNYYNSVLFLIIFIILNSTNSSAIAAVEIGDVGPDVSFFSKLENSDVAFVGTIESIETTTHPIVGELSILYNFIDVSTIESAGLVGFNGVATIRFFGGSDSSNIKHIDEINLNLKGRRVIAFVKNNGIVKDPLVGNQNGSGMLFVDSDGYISTRKGVTILGVDEFGVPITKRQINSCQLEDIGELSGTVNDPNNPRGVRDLTREELLSQITAFSCPGGDGVWRRDAEIMTGENPTPIGFDDFTSALVNHRRSLRIADSDQASLRNPPNDSLDPFLSQAKSLTPEAAGLWVGLLDQGIKLQQNKLDKIQMMLRIRGESLPERYLHLLSEKGRGKLESKGVK